MSHPRIALALVASLFLTAASTGALPALDLGPALPQSAAADQLLLLADTLPGDDFARAIALAKAATTAQMAMVGAPLPAVPSTHGAVAPSIPARLLLEQLGVAVGAEERETLAQLDALPEPTRAAMADLLAAFAVFHARAQPPRLPGAPEELGLLAPALAARNALLDASLGLRDALATTRDPLPAVISLSPALAVDFAGADSIYTEDVRLIVDAAGNDLYLNNAGGNGGCWEGCQIGRAAALLDLAGADAYAAIRGQGVNGGGFQGLGLLIDAAGNDFYGAKDDGSNGGGYFGAGLLLDAAGFDVYQASGWGSNGGGYPGGVGMLLDQGGDDLYLGSFDGVNGGAVAGAGFLFDTAGNDVYDATHRGTNGGASFSGRGFLLDGAGDDRYTAQDWGANGGGNGGSLGYLRDAGGHDWYQDLEGGTGWDITIVPKGPLGAQLDD